MEGEPLALQVSGRNSQAGSTRVSPSRTAALPTAHQSKGSRPGLKVNTADPLNASLWASISSL